MMWAMLAHGGEPFQPHDLWTGSAWNFDLWILIPLGVTTLIYLLGIRNLWGHAGIGHGISLRSCISFLGGILALILALVTPLDALGHVLFFAHMLQHMSLMLIAAPLLVTGNFSLAWLWALPRTGAKKMGRDWNGSRILSRIWAVLVRPIMAWCLFTIALWVWHISALYEAALQNEMIHTLEHLTFLVTAMLFWWALIKHTTQNHIHYGMAVPYLFTTMLHSGVLGALITFATEPWYPHYTDLTSAWGLTRLQDQQLAGLIMWVPGGAVFALLTIVYFAVWLRAIEERSLRMKQRDTV